MKVFLIIIAITGWFGLIAQLYLHLANAGQPVDEALIRYFSYFTILTNLIIAIAASVFLIIPMAKFGRFTGKPTTQTAIAVYIAIVGITYNLLLRQVWNPEGLQRVVDETLHVIMPLLWILYWIFCVPKQQLKWSDSWPWLLYPLIYTIIIFIRGAASGFCPYFFIDAGVLGMPKAILNAVFVGVAFWVMSLLFIGIGRFQERKEARR